MNVNEVMKELAQYMRIADETAAIIEGLKDKLKGYMIAEGLDTLAGDEHKASYKDVTTNRIDTKALKHDLPEIAQRYTTGTTTKRFTFA